MKRFNSTVLFRMLIATAGLSPWAILAIGTNGLVLKPVFHTFCHQMPGRTLMFHGVSMVVCSRCAGIYAGIAAGALLPPFRSVGSHGRWLFMAALTAMAADVFTQDIGWHPVFHATRLGTGLAVGYISSAFLFSKIKDETTRTNSAPTAKPMLGRLHEL